MTHHPQPAIHHPQAGMIPGRLLMSMAFLAASALAIVGAATVANRPVVGVPQAAAVQTERLLILEGHGAKAVKVRNVDGSILADMEHGGFVTVVQNGLQRHRLVHGVPADLPVRLIRYADGRLSLLDPETGWTIELYAFGADNKAAFERLLAQ